jgi:hypothetical protein
LVSVLIISLMGTVQVCGNIISCMVLYILVQFMQDWNHMAWIGYESALIAATKACIFLPYAYVEYQDEVVSSKEYYMGPVQAFVNPQPTWYNYCIAVTGFFYTFVVTFIMFEVRSSMKDPTQCKTALNVSALVQVIIYLVAGIMAVMMWGWNAADPVTVEIPREGWVGLFASIAALVITALDYCIAAKIANT